MSMGDRPTQSETRGTLTEDDWERIRTFAAAPNYRREPEMLVPGLLEEEEE
jgi:hypothetical protein